MESAFLLKGIKIVLKDERTGKWMNSILKMVEAFNLKLQKN